MLSCRFSRFTDGIKNTEGARLRCWFFVLINFDIYILCVKI